MKRVLFLCTGNSARSIMAEAALNHAAPDRFQAFSAGSNPAGQVNPFAIAALRKLGYQTAGLRSKSWDEFATADAPALDLVVTVCDNAANEVCPVWPGAPLSTHWGLPDPAVFEGSEVMKEAEFDTAFSIIWRRINALIKLDLDDSDRVGLKTKLDAIADIG